MPSDMVAPRMNASRQFGLGHLLILALGSGVAFTLLRAANEFDPGGRFPIVVAVLIGMVFGPMLGRIWNSNDGGFWGGLICTLILLFVACTLPRSEPTHYNTEIPTHFRILEEADSRQ